MSDFIERRRTPRVELRTDEIVQLELRQRTQLLDLSESGALLGCDAPLPVGTRGQLRAGLGGLPFTAEVAVRRHQVRSTGGRQVGHGARFSAMDERSARFLGQFLQKGKNDAR